MLMKSEQKDFYSLFLHQLSVFEINNEAKKKYAVAPAQPLDRAADALEPGRKLGGGGTLGTPNTKPGPAVTHC